MTVQRPENEIHAVAVGYAGLLHQRMFGVSLGRMLANVPDNDLLHIFVTRHDITDSGASFIMRWILIELSMTTYARYTELKKNTEEKSCMMNITENKKMNENVVDTTNMKVYRNCSCSKPLYVRSFFLRSFILDAFIFALSKICIILSTPSIRI